VNASGITYGEIQDSINSGTGFSIQSTNSDWPSSAGWLLRMLQAAKMEALETFHQRQDQVSAEKQNLLDGGFVDHPTDYPGQKVLPAQKDQEPLPDTPGPFEVMTEYRLQHIIIVQRQEVTGVTEILKTSTSLRASSYICSVVWVWVGPNEGEYDWLLCIYSCYILGKK